MNETYAVRLCNRSHQVVKSNMKSMSSVFGLHVKLPYKAFAISAWSHIWWIIRLTA